MKGGSTMKAMVVMSAVVFGVTCSPLRASSDTLKVSPVRTAVIPSDGSDHVQVSVQFDLSGIRSGSNRTLNEAFLEWIPNSVSDDTRTEFSVFEVTSPWEQEGVTDGDLSITADTEAKGSWEVEPDDYERVGGLVRLNILELVEQWLATPNSNYGLMITIDGAGEGISDELGSMKLIIRYGFVSPEDQ